MSMLLRCCACWMLIVCLSIWFSEANAQIIKKKDRKKKADTVVVKPPVKRLHREVHWSCGIENNEGGKPQYKTAEIWYDSLGHKRRWLQYDAQGQVRQEYNYLYTSESRELRRYWKRGDSLFLDLVEVYLDNGAISTRTYYKGEEQFLYRVIFDYDTKSRLIKETAVGPRGENRYEVQYQYNDYQQSQSEQYIDYLSKETYQTAIALDSVGHPVERQRYKQSGASVERITYRYDEQGRLLERTVYKGSKKLDSKEVYTYFEPEKTALAVYLGEESELVEYWIYEYFYQ